MTVTPAREEDRLALAALATPLQARPDRHVAYASTDAEGIAEGLADLNEWRRVSAVARENGAVVAWLVGDTDVGLERVWWWGPFVAGEAWARTASELYAFAVARLPRAITGQEMAVDARFADAITWAGANGFRVDPGSAVLSIGPGGLSDADPGRVSIRALAPSDTFVADLHDALFAGSHVTGAALLEPTGRRHVRLVGERSGRIAGYVAVDVQPDGDGYVDFLGVDPKHRGCGVGRALVIAGVQALRARGCGFIHLTVRETNTVARGLYASLGFEEERVIVPLRKGFRLLG